jgi:hypothetical protein
MISKEQGLKANTRVMLAAVILLMATLFLVGCGGDAGRARDYMNKGDAEVAKLKPVSDRFTKSVSALFAGVFAGGKVDAASFQKDAAGVKTLADQLSAGAKEAAKQYALIDGLKDVPSYKKYADLEQQVMTLNEDGLAKLKAFLDKWTAAISSTSFDPVAFVGAAKEFSGQADSAAKEITKLETEAANLKNSRKL